MATITSTGIGSGLDVEAIITKLMAVEQRPLTALQTKEASYQSKLTAYGSLKSAMSQFQTAISGLSSASVFQAASATIADTTIASATANTSAAPGAYSLEVSKLAQAQKLVANGLVSDNTSVGNGVISIDFGTISGGSFNSTTGQYTGASFTSAGSSVKTVTIDSSNNSLSGIRDAINNANIGIAASIINDGSGTPYRLALSVNNSGSANSMKISVSGDAALSSLLGNDPAGVQNLAETTAAQNAALKVNGISISKSSNSVSDVISGVTLNLLKTTASATSIAIARDTSSVTTAVNNFVSAYNTISKTLKNAMAYDASTKTAAELNGEASVRSIQSQIRSVLRTPVSGDAGGYSMLSDVGLTMQKDGTLSVNSAKLATALSTHFGDFAALFATAGKTSDSLVTYTGASSKTQAGTYAVTISQMATQGAVTGSGAAGLNITTGLNDTINVQLDGTTATVTLAQGNYTATSLAAEIQSKVNSASVFSNLGSAVRVTESSGILTITSNLYGSSSKVSITGGNAKVYLQLGLGISGLNVAGTINGVAATGSGQTLSGANGDDSEGLRLTITGGGLGSRGSVSYSQGFAYRLNELTGILLGEDGPISSRTEGLTAIIKRLENEQTRMGTRMTAIEKQYRTQFTALDVLISNLNTTSTFLTQQLEALSNSTKS